MSDLWSLRVSAGKSQKRRELTLLLAGISATLQVWRAFLLGMCKRELSHEGLPSVLLCSLSSLRSKPGWLEARPVVMLQKPAGAGKDCWACGVLSTALFGALPVASVGRKMELSLPGRHWLSYIPPWNLHCSATSRPRFLNIFYPLHRVVLLSITCSVRNGSSDLLSTYCVPCTKFPMWMISLDFQNWYE